MRDEQDDILGEGHSSYTGMEEELSDVRSQPAWLCWEGGWVSHLGSSEGLQR